MEEGSFIEVEEDESELRTLRKQSADDVHIQTMWNHFNTADDRYTMFIERAIPNEKKTVACFNCSIAGEFESIINRCRREHIPRGLQEAEFIFKIMDLRDNGHWVTGGNKRMIITHPNSAMADNQSGGEGDLSRTLSGMFENQQAFLERLLDKGEKKSNRFLEFLTTETGGAIVAIAAPAIVKILVDAVSRKPATPLTEVVQMMEVIKDLGGDDKGDDSMSSIIKTAMETFGKPIGEIATLVQKQRAGVLVPAAQPGQVVDSGASAVVDQSIADENRRREVKIEGETARDFLTSLVRLTLNGARRDASWEQYAQVVLDQVGDDQLDDFLTMIKSPVFFEAICEIDAGCKEYQDWYANLVLEIVADVDLSEIGDGDTLSGDDETNETIENAEGAEGDESHPAGDG